MYSYLQDARKMWNLTTTEGITGGEVAMWGEVVDEHNFDAKVWPRGAALAEALWSDPSGGWWEAKYRMQHHRQRMVEQGIDAAAMQTQWCMYNDGCFVPPALSAEPAETNCTKDGDCPGTDDYCMDGPGKTPPFSCHKAAAPPPPTPPAAVPSCKGAGKAVLCEIACESTCREFAPGFKAAGCAEQKYCTSLPAWATGSVCRC